MRARRDCRMGDEFVVAKWLYKAIQSDLTPESTRADSLLVCLDLKSSPTINALCLSARSAILGTRAFCGEP